MLRRSFVCLVLVLSLQSIPVFAQDQVALSVESFWLTMDQTNTLLLAYLETLPEDATIIPDDLNHLWDNVAAVHLPDDTVIRIDTSWLVFEEETSYYLLEITQARVEALLFYWLEQSGMSGDSEEMLRRLRELMSRFQYENREIPEEEENTTAVIVFPGIAETILLIMGILAAAGVIAYLVRDLQIQSAAIAPEGEDDELPTTSEAADDLAAQSEAIQDYRAAIRYLYLPPPPPLV